MTNPTQDGFRDLPVTPEVVELRNRHRDFYRSLVLEARESERRGEIDAWADVIAADLDNFRAAMEWSISRGDAVEAVDLATGCQTVWERGRFREGRDWTSRALALLSTRGAERVRALNCLATIANRAGDRVAESQWSGEALEAARELGDEALLAEALAARGRSFIYSHDMAAAGAVLEEAVPVARSAGPSRVLADALRGLGFVAWRAGDTATALLRHDEALEALAGAPAEAVLEHLYSHAGMLEMVKPGGAAEMYHRALDLERASPRPERAIYALFPLAGIAERAGETERAVELYEEVVALSGDREDAGYASGALVALGRIAAEAGDPATARSRFTDAADRVGTQPTEPGWGAHANLAHALEGHAQLAELDADQARARRLLQERLAIPRSGLLFRVHSLGLIADHADRIGDRTTALRYHRLRIEAAKAENAPRLHLAACEAALATAEGDLQGALAAVTGALGNGDRSSWVTAAVGKEETLAFYALRAGDLDLARVALTAVIDRVAAIGLPIFYTRLMLAEVEVGAGRVEEAAALLAVLHPDRRKFWTAPYRLNLLRAEARVTAHTDPERGAGMLGTVEAERERLQYVLPSWVVPWLEAAAAAARAALGAERFDAAFAQGRRVPAEIALRGEVG